VENKDMNITLVESLLESSLKSKWSIKGEHLCFTDGDTRFLFDKIEDSLFGFTKLILVSDGRLIEMSLFNKFRLAPMVRARKNLVIRYMKDAARVKMMEDRYKVENPKPPAPPKPRLEGLTKPISREDVVNKWGTMGSQLLGGRNTGLSVRESMIKRVTEAKEKTEAKLTDAEIKANAFRKNVSVEKLRIRELLRKNK